MNDMEKLELLKAALAVAAADGRISRPEKGVILGLASKVGVGSASMEAMMDAAKSGAMEVDSILIRSPSSARTALELLVAEARLDGQITDEERTVLVEISTRLKITGDEFQTIYQAGIARADQLRRRR